MGQGLVTYGEYSQIECEFLLAWMPVRRDAVEVGANIGCHTLPMAKALSVQNRRLLAVEPQPIVFQQLCANLALNHVRNVQALNQACGARRSTLHYSRKDYDQPGNFGAVRLRGDSREGDERMDAVPLDESLGQDWDVGFLKIDVEGMESEVLLGAQDTIQRCRPVIYLENDQVDKSRSLIEQIWSLDYSIWFHLPTLFNPQNFAQQTNNLYPNVVSINMLCLPNEASVKPSVAPLSDANWHPLLNL
jgi:FkbM family methyltransferase